MILFFVVFPVLAQLPHNNSIPLSPLTKVTVPFDDKESERAWSRIYQLKIKDCCEKVISKNINVHKGCRGQDCCKVTFTRDDLWSNCMVPSIKMWNYTFFTTSPSPLLQVHHHLLQCKRNPLQTLQQSDLDFNIPLVSVLLCI